MKRNQWIKIFLVGTCMVFLVGCHSMRKYQNQAAIDDANTAYGHPTAVADAGVKTSGLGEEARFGEQARNRKKLAAADPNHIYYFDFDSNVVHDGDKPAIAANANRISGKSKAKVLLEGHTDPRGSREYNIGLGERRAKAVAEILTAHGVNPSQIRIVSYGAEKLASNGHTESDYQMDRRGVLVYLQR